MQHTNELMHAKTMEERGSKNTKESDSKVEQVGGKRGDKPDRTKSSKMQVEGSH